MSDTPAAVILAGGLSRRMAGGNKAHRALGDKSLIEHVCARLAPQTDRLLISANDDPHGDLAALGLPVVPDMLLGRLGPLAGIVSAMLYLHAHHPACRHLVSVACDVPFLPTDFVRRLCDAQRRTGKEIVTAASNGRVHHVLSLWPIAMAGQLRDAIVNRRIRSVFRWLAERDVFIAAFSTAHGDPFFNVNTDEDLACATAFLHGRRSTSRRIGGAPAAPLPAGIAAAVQLASPAAPAPRERGL